MKRQVKRCKTFQIRVRSVSKEKEKKGGKNGGHQHTRHKTRQVVETQERVLQENQLFIMVVSR